MGSGYTPQLQASVAAAILMSSPSMMINFALGAFLTGIGTYLGFVWQKDLDTIAGKSESRNVFVCFLISLVFCYTFYMLPFLSKLWEEYKKSPRHKEETDDNIRKTGELMVPLFMMAEAIERMGFEHCPFPEVKKDWREKLLPRVKVVAWGVRLHDYKASEEAVKAAKAITVSLKEWEIPEKESLTWDPIWKKVDKGEEREIPDAIVIEQQTETGEEQGEGKNDDKEKGTENMV